VITRVFGRAARRSLRLFIRGPVVGAGCSG